MQCVRCSPGSASSGSACERPVAACRTWASRPEQGWPVGIRPRSAACYAIPPTPDQPCSAAPGPFRLSTLGCALYEAAPTRRAKPTAQEQRRRVRSGSLLLYPPSWTPAYLRLCRGSSMRTAGASAKGAAVLGGCYKVSWSAVSAAMPSMARWLAAGLGGGSRPITATTGAPVPTPTSLVAKRFAATALCAAISWSPWSGGRSRWSWRIPSVSRPSTSAASQPAGKAALARM